MIHGGWTKQMKPLERCTNDENGRLDQLAGASQQQQEICNATFKITEGH